MRLALVEQRVINVVPGTLFVNKISNWSKEAMTLPKMMVVAQCSTPSTVMVSLLENPVSVVRFDKVHDSKLAKMERHCAVAKENASEKAAHCIKQE